ncbi:hypothetical protein BCEN4_2620002 [Burkholderia cenocepacia]|nr:hypothetical protein BCEN4_2620002 [Burkholderia cenocepacia]
MLVQTLGNCAIPTGGQFGFRRFCLVLAVKRCKHACSGAGHPRGGHIIQPFDHLRNFRVLPCYNFLHIVPAEAIWPFRIAGLLCKKVSNCDGLRISCQQLI